jgi:glycosyltransferase involved in cell wall biosynthesis
VFRQTWRDWELLIVDDGSTDGSGIFLSALARATPRVRYFRQENAGLASARNAGLRRARGKFVAFLDSDDEYTPTHLARLARYLTDHPHLDAVHGVLKPVGPRNRQYVPDVDHPGRRIHAARCHAAGTLLARRASLRLIGGFRVIPFSEDYDLIRRLARECRISPVPFRTYRYHVDAEHRLCELFEKGGVAGIRRFRRGSGGAGKVSLRGMPLSSHS